MAFTLKYPMVDQIVDKICDKGPEPKLMKVDISRAYRNLRSDPFDFPLLGLKWKGATYIDCFGLKYGSCACQIASECISFLMHQTKYWCCTYLDDAICVTDPANAASAFLSLQNLITTLGLPVNA